MCTVKSNPYVIEILILTQKMTLHVAKSRRKSSKLLTNLLTMGCANEEKRKLLLYPIEYQRGSRCEWVLGFARTAVMRAGSNMGPGGQG